MIFQNITFLGLISFFIAVVVSFTLHEYAHGKVALWNGDPTAKYQGRVSLNPLKHFDPIGFLMLMAVGFGFAKPVPVNPNNFKKLKRGIFTVAIAGVTVNIILAFFSTALFILFGNLFNSSSGVAQNIIYFFQLLFLYMVFINISLALFNLLPLYPLDGFRVVEAFTRYNNPVTKFLRVYGQYILLGLIAVSILIDVTGVTRVAPVFGYFDLLGLYIGKVGGYIRTGFIKFWELII